MDMNRERVDYKGTREKKKWIDNSITYTPIPFPSLCFSFVLFVSFVHHYGRKGVEKRVMMIRWHCSQTVTEGTRKTDAFTHGYI